MVWPTHRLHACLLGGLAAVVLSASGHAGAQTLALSQSDAVACMTPAGTERGQPDYPREMIDARQGGDVEVEMIFTSPDLPPRVTVRGKTVAQNLVDSVQRHVARYRVPCLLDGQPVTIRQVFSFVWHAAGRVNWSEPTDQEDLRRKEAWACLKRPAGDEKIVYPTHSLRRGEAGTVVLRLRFTKPDAEPAVEVLSDAGSPTLAAAAIQHTRGQRIPCLGTDALNLVQFYTFKISGATSFALKNMPLPRFVQAIDGLSRQSVYFDTREMGCPFDLVMSLRQPYASNPIKEVGEPDPRRALFLDWLRRQSLQMSAADLNRAVTSEFMLEVPCMVLNLGASSGGTGSN